MKKIPPLFVFVVFMAFLLVVVLVGGMGCGQDSTSNSTNVTITYNANGGRVSPLANTVSAGSSVSLPLPTRSSHVFNGWYTALDGGTMIGVADDSFTVDADITLYAQWTSGVTVYYNSNGGTVSPSNESVSVGDSVTLPTPTRIGYFFSGWYNARGVLVGTAGDKYTVNGDMQFLGGLAESLDAGWKLIVTITFNANGGNVSPLSETAPAESSIYLPSPSRNGYAFNGWYTATSGGTRVGGAGDNYIIPITVSANTYLFAQWTPSEVTVTYNATDGNVVPQSETVIAKSSVTLPTPSRSGYTFTGWYSALSGGTRVGGAGDSFIVETNVTLYARWEQ